MDKSPWHVREGVVLAGCSSLAESWDGGGQLLSSHLSHLSWLVIYTFSFTADDVDVHPSYICVMIRNSHLGRRRHRQNLHLREDCGCQGTRCCVCSSWWESQTDKVGWVGKTMRPPMGAYVLERSCAPHGSCFHIQFFSLSTDWCKTRSNTSQQ